MTQPVRRLDRLRDFVRAVDTLVRSETRESRLLIEGAALLRDLIALDDWLPDDLAKPGSPHYRQYLLHRDPAARFSVVSFVWGPGQSTAVHDHTVWGLVGVLRGAELSQSYRRTSGRLAPAGAVKRLEVGDVEAVSPTIGDLHRVANAFDDRISISIHVYGADIGAVSRHTFDDAGRPKTFISGYADAPVPEIGLLPVTS